MIELQDLKVLHWFIQNWKWSQLWITVGSRCFYSRKIRLKRTYPLSLWDSFFFGIIHQAGYYPIVALLQNFS